MEAGPLNYDLLRPPVAGGRPHVVIVGGGFAGLYAALALAREPIDLTLVDRRNHHLFQPLLYQVATAALAAPDIAAPIRNILRRQKNARVLLDEAVGVDLAARRLKLAGGSLSYDLLLAAPGARDSYFGHDEWSAFAPGLKTIDDAFRIRGDILLAYEEAERTLDPERRRMLLTFVVIGGGPTGVELAGSLAEIARHTLARNFRSFVAEDARVILLEGGDRVLPTYPPELSAKAREQLERLGAEVRTGARVTHVGPEGVRVGDVAIAARTVLWAAGVEAAPLTRAFGAPLDRHGRVLVEPDLSLPGHPEVFVLGDAAAVRRGPGVEAWVPGVAPAAIQMGKCAAKNVARRLAGKPTEAFVYRDKGSLATIGRKAAVADLGRFRCSGALAWMLWLFIHVFFLIGFRNRIAVMAEWAFAYVTYQRSARVIVERTRRPDQVRANQSLDQ